MTRWYTILTIAACALSAHCSSGEDDWEQEGRIYASADLTVARVAVSPTADLFPVGEGETVYVAKLDLAPGALPWGNLDAKAYTYLPPASTITFNDKPTACRTYRLDAENPEDTARECLQFPWDVEADRGDDPRSEPWPLLSPDAATKDVWFEVRRPAGAPSIEDATWKVIVADQTCKLALDARNAHPECADGAECSADSIVYQVDATSCRWRNRN
jgi:hypothetical protein